jgi:hypothetical protein
MQLRATQRNGTVIANTTGTTWADSTIVHGSSYTYFVTAQTASLAGMSSGLRV